MIKLEAEHLALSNYLVEDSNFASGGELVSLLESSKKTGTASTQFSGAPGVYHLAIGAFDESDSEASVQLLVNDEGIDNWRLDEDIDSPSPYVAHEANFTLRILFTETLSSVMIRKTYKVISNTISKVASFKIFCQLNLHPGLFISSLVRFCLF